MTTNAKEVKLHAPTDFHKACEQTTKFLQEVKIYMHANTEIYNTEEKKVLFALSFMNGGSCRKLETGKDSHIFKNWKLWHL
jgi:thiosulfate reductase cytochrome b subunit